MVLFYYFPGAADHDDGDGDHPGGLARQGALGQFFKRNVNHLPGTDPVDVFHMGVEAFENTQEFPEIGVGKLTFLTEDFEHPVPLLNLVGVTEDVPAAVVAHHIVFIKHGAMGVYRQKQQDKRDQR